jgi:RNA 3'-terminal phosphate cyclase (ATP)
MIDGRGPCLEGYEAGGQILRVALALSAILKKSFKIQNIRAGRPKPGLQPQHLTCVNAINEITGGEIEGNTIGSMEIFFKPETIKGGNYTFDTGTAGSVTLLAQSILPIMLFANNESHIILRGGTHVSWSPTVDYFEHVFLPLVKKLGAKVYFKINRYGWYPRGKGEIELEIKPSKLRGINLVQRGRLKCIKGVCAYSKLDINIPEREISAACEILPEMRAADVTIVKKEAASPGTALTLWADYENTIIGVEALGAIGKSAETVGYEAASYLKEELTHDAAVDKHMSDQLLIFLSLAEGNSYISIPELTSHAKTCTWLIPQFTGVEFKINKNILSVSGIGV